MKKKLILSIFCSIFIVIGLYYLSVLSYPIFHLSIELVSMLIGVFIFIIALMASKLKQLNFVSIIGPGFLVSSLVLFIHAITYQGLNLFPDYDSNLPTQLWIISNIIIVSSVLFGALYLNSNKGFLLYTTLMSIIGVSFTIMAFLKVFPDCYIEGTGLTAFKIYTEYVIIALYILSIAIIIRKVNIKKEKLYFNITISIIFLIIAEFMFTQYASVFGIQNFLGHIIRAVGLILIFNSIVITTFTEPIATIFKKISEDYKTEIYQLYENSLIANKELKEAEQLLQKSLGRNSAILRAIPDIMFILSEEGVFLDYYTPDTASLYASPDFFIGKTIHEVLPAEVAIKYELQIKNIINKEQITVLEYSLDFPDGLHYYEARSIVSEVDNIVSIVRDVTDKKRKMNN